MTEHAMDDLMNIRGRATAPRARRFGLLPATLASALALIFSAIAPPARACATCGCTLSKDWLGPQAGSVSGWSADLSYDFIDQKQMRIGQTNLDQAGAQAILNPPASTGNEVELQTLTRILTLGADYNSADWGVSLQVPIIDRYHTTLTDGTTDGYDYSQFHAIGDVRVLGKYAVAPDGSIGVIAGLKLPTGGTSQQFKGSLGSGAVDPSLQPGTGSTDLLLGGYYAGQADSLGWFAQGLWQHAIDSQDGYTPGDAITLNAGLRYGELGQRVVPLVQLNFVHRNADTGVNASVAYDGTDLTGGNLLYIAPGVSGALGGGFSAFAYVQFPVYQDVNGVQLTPRQIYSFGLRKVF
jgi:hypothetical protein